VRVELAGIHPVGLRDTHCLQVESWLALEKSLFVQWDKAEEKEDCFGQNAADWGAQG